MTKLVLKDMTQLQRPIILLAKNKDILESQSTYASNLWKEAWLNGVTTVSSKITEDDAIVVQRSASPQDPDWLRVLYLYLMERGLLLDNFESAT